MSLKRACQSLMASAAGRLAASEAASSLEALKQQARRYANLPEDIATAARSARYPSRQPRQPRSAAAAEPAAAEASASEAAAAAATPESLAAQQREAAQIASRWMFPWERRQMEGGALKPWEKLYWGVFVSAVALFLFNRLREGEPAEVVVDEEREARKAELARLVLAGRSVLEGEEDLFDGLTPEEIAAYVAESTGGASAADPYEGLTPEEINAYVAQHGAGAGGAAVAGAR